VPLVFEGSWNLPRLVNFSCLVSGPRNQERPSSVSGRSRASRPCSPPVTDARVVGRNRPSAAESTSLTLRQTTGELGTLSASWFLRATIPVFTEQFLRCNSRDSAWNAWQGFRFRSKIWSFLWLGAPNSTSKLDHENAHLSLVLGALEPHNVWWHYATSCPDHSRLASVH